MLFKLLVRQPGSIVALLPDTRRSAHHAFAYCARSSCGETPARKNSQRCEVLTGAELRCTADDGGHHEDPKETWSMPSRADGVCRWPGGSRGPDSSGRARSICRHSIARRAAEFRRLLRGVSRHGWARKRRCGSSDESTSSGPHNAGSPSRWQVRFCRRGVLRQGNGENGHTRARNGRDADLGPCICSAASRSACREHACEEPRWLPRVHSTEEVKG